MLLVILILIIEMKKCIVCRLRINDLKFRKLNDNVWKLRVCI